MTDKIINLYLCIIFIIFFIIIIKKEMIKAVSDEMNFHKKEVQILKSEKDTLESVLSMKT